VGMQVSGAGLDRGFVMMFRGFFRGNELWRSV
jgi:hypothetical protein